MPPAAVERVRAALAPDSQVVRVRPLRGGISASVHLVQFKGPDGQRSAVVVRRYGEYWQRTDPAACVREFKVLKILADSSFPAPRPLLLDAEGGPFGAPTVVITRLPGRPQLMPRDLASYVKQLARTLADLHRLPTDQLAFLPDQRDMVRRVLSQRPETTDSLHLEVWEAAAAEWSRVSRLETQRVLVHGDYWPGNLLWLRGRLVGLIDWEQPRLGDPTRDVATCRGDLTVLFGHAIADDLLIQYERAAGTILENLRFWELLTLCEAVPEMPNWAVGYRMLGRPDLTAEQASARIRAFARACIDRL